MKREDMTSANAVCEAIGIVSSLLYIGLQIYCGILYETDMITIIMNIVMVVLVYVGITLLSVSPEKVNRLDPEVCTGKVRRLTIQMLLYVKLVFILSLLIPSVCDVLGVAVDSAYSLISTGLMIAIAVGYELKILKLLKEEL